MKPNLSHLQIRVHLADGSLTTFIQDDPGEIKQSLDRFQPVQIFSREKIVLADRYSHTSFFAARVTRIDLDPEGEGHHLVFPVGLVKAVELTRTEFEVLIRNPAMREQWAQVGTLSKSVVAFLDVQMADGQAVLLTMEMNLEPPAKLPDINRACLGGSDLCFRMRTGGVAVLNLANLTRLTLFPGPLPTPGDAWPARFFHTTRPVSPNSPHEVNAAVMSHPPPIHFPLPSQHSNRQRKQMRTQNENQPSLERNLL